MASGRAVLGGVQPSRLMSSDLSNPETASPVTQSIGFQPNQAAKPDACVQKSVKIRAAGVGKSIFIWSKDP